VIVDRNLHNICPLLVCCRLLVKQCRNSRRTLCKQDKKQNFILKYQFHRESDPEIVVRQSVDPWKPQMCNTYANSLWPQNPQSLSHS
jgi:hypothetical protein